MPSLSVMSYYIISIIGVGPTSIVDELNVKVKFSCDLSICLRLETLHPLNKKQNSSYKLRYLAFRPQACSASLSPTKSTGYLLPPADQ